MFKFLPAVTHSRGSNRASFTSLLSLYKRGSWARSYNALSRDVASVDKNKKHFAFLMRVVETSDCCNLTNYNMAHTLFKLVDLHDQRLFSRVLKHSTSYRMLVSFLFCIMLLKFLLTWIFSFSLAVRMRGRSSALFWLRPQWSWTNWWRRSARLWRSPNPIGRPAGWPDRSVNGAEMVGGGGIQNCCWKSFGGQD